MNRNLLLLPPEKEYIPFNDEDHYSNKGREWGLFGTNVKTTFLYKDSGNTYSVTIKGYEEHGINNFNVIVIEFEDGNLSCVHPSHFKDMQTAGFENLIPTNSDQKPLTSRAAKPKAKLKKSIDTVENSAQIEKNDEKKENKPSKEIKQKLNLPVDKVQFEATLKEFSTMYNHFKEEDDEIILFEDVKILGDEGFIVGDAWCGYSNTLKKAELAEGNKLKFFGKVVEKKFNKEVIYKINNPSKLTK